MADCATETNDIASEHPALVGDLARHYDEWAARCGANPRDEILEMLRTLAGKAFWENDATSIVRNVTNGGRSRP